MEKPKPETDDILDVLAVLRKHRGGKTVDRPSGMTTDKIRSRLRGETHLTVVDLSALLASMGVDPVEFAAWRAAGFHPEVYLRELEKKRPSQVRHLRALAARTPVQEYSAEEIRRQAEGLEELRLFDVDAALQGALEILRTAEHRPAMVDRDSLCEAWGIVGAIQRSRGRGASAAYGLLQALVVGGAGQVSTLRRTSTLQRVAYLMGYEGDLDLSEQVLDIARLIGVREKDWQAVGRVMVSWGGFVGRGGRLGESIDAYSTSLQLLPPGEWYGRFSAYQGLGVSWAFRGDLDESLTQLEKALEVLEPVAVAPPIIRYGALWLRAEILMLRGNLSAARSDFQRVKEIFVARGMTPIDIALVSLRLAKILLLEGNRVEFHQISRQMFALLRAIERQNGLLSAAYAEFMNLTVQGKVTVEFLESLYRKMHGSAAAAPPLLPLTGSPRPGVGQTEPGPTGNRLLEGRTDRSTDPMK